MRRLAALVLLIPTLAMGVDAKLPSSVISHAPTIRWSCGLDNVGATLTQCQAAPAAGLKLYVTDVIAQSTTIAGGQLLIRYGTGTNCATGVTSLLPPAATVARLGYPANTSAPLVINLSTPIVAAAANAICVICVASGTCSVTLIGFVAP